MKKIVFICSVVLMTSQLSSAQSIKSVFESFWTGASSSRSDITESGVFLCTEELYNVSFNEYDNTFTGVLKTIFNLDGIDYSYKANIKGTFYESDYSVVIKVVNRIDYDELPDGLYWIDTDVNLTIYTDSEHEGYFLLSGQSSNQVYSDEIFELSNYSY